MKKLTAIETMRHGARIHWRVVAFTPSMTGVDPDRPEVFAYGVTDSLAQARLDSAAAQDAVFSQTWVTPEAQA